MSSKAWRSSLCQKKIKEANTQITERQNDLKKVQDTIDERKEDLEHKRNELDDIMKETRDAEAELKEKAKELETKIEPRLLARHKRIRKSARNGLGIVYVQRDACGGCFNKIPPQRQARYQDAQENHRLRVLRPYPHRS